MLEHLRYSRLVTRRRRVLLGCLVAAGALTGGLYVAAANKLTTLKLGDSGWVVDAPAGWKVKASNDHFFMVLGPKMGHAFEVWLHKAFDLPPQPDKVVFRDLARDMSCDDPDKAEYGRTPAGGYYAQCASTQTLTGKTVPRQMKLLLTITIDKIDTACSLHGNPELDPDDVAVCKSLRKLDAPRSK